MPMMNATMEMDVTFGSKKLLMLNFLSSAFFSSESSISGTLRATMAARQTTSMATQKSMM